ncbi:MAG: alpha/beta hydrolase [Proteobacteria bacterium]|nr:alpha/beta hydrolase [Pseudomonadota bacterium]
MPVFEQGDVSIYYEQHGSASGFPVMLLPPGGMDATVDRWKRVGFAAIETFSEYRVVILDQRNAGRSTGPLDFDDPWGRYCDDQLGLASYLGLDRFHVVGQCIGCSYALTLSKRAPERIVSAVLVQPIGLDDSNRAHWPNMQGFLASHFFETWSEALLRKRPELDRAAREKFARRMFSGEFVFSVSREDVGSCAMPLLVLPGVDAIHPGTIGREVAQLARSAEVVDQWKGPEFIAKAIDRVHKFLKAHTPT